MMFQRPKIIAHLNTSSAENVVVVLITIDHQRKWGWTKLEQEKWSRGRQVGIKDKEIKGQIDSRVVEVTLWSEREL